MVEWCCPSGAAVADKQRCCDAASWSPEGGCQPAGGAVGVCEGLAESQWKLLQMQWALVALVAEIGTWKNYR